MLVPYIEKYTKYSYAVRAPYCLIFKFDKFYLYNKYKNNARFIEFFNNYAAIFLEMNIIDGAKNYLFNLNEEYTEARILASVLDNYSTHLDSDLWDTITNYDIVYYDKISLDSDDATAEYYDGVASLIDEIMNFLKSYVDYDKIINTYINYVLFCKYDIPDYIADMHPDGDSRVFYPSVRIYDDMVHIYFEFNVWRG